MDVLVSRPLKSKLLVVESSSQMRTSLWLILKNEFEVFTARDLESALQIARREEVDLAIVGVMFRLSFYESFFAAMREVRPHLPLLGLLEDIPAREEKLNLPDLEWLNKPFTVHALREAVRRLLSRKGWVERKRELGFTLPSLQRTRRWLHSSRISLAVRQKALEMCASPFPIFIQGEEGTGTAELAKAMHFQGPTRDRPFLGLFCPGLTVERFVQKVSFWLKNTEFPTDGSLTLYLEDVDRLDGDVQTALLDIWNDERIYWPGLEGRIKARFISSSSSSLARAVSAGIFREDLHQILEMLPLSLPPLRERRDEIPAIVAEILEETGSGKRLSPEAVQLLGEYYWPGNVRELEALLLRSAELSRREVLIPEDLVFTFTQGDAPALEMEKKESGAMPVPPLRDPDEESFFDAAVSVLAHEIKNPLVAISTFAHLLPEKYEDREFREQFSPIVGMEVKRINLLLENLLEYVQLAPPRFCGNDLNFIVNEVLSLSGEQFLPRGGRLSCDLMPDLPAVLFDADQLRYVIRKILENTAFEIAENSEVRLVTNRVLKKVDADREFVQLRFYYHGQDGIIRKVARGLEDSSAPKPCAGYTNLSLALLLALQVVNRNGGEMQVTQEEEGTSIRLLFPVSG